MKKVAIYVRVSTLEQAEKGYSIGQQTERLKKYAEIKDWLVYDTFIDAGHSGASLERPALQKMLNEVENYNGVLVYKLDRLSRSQKDTLFLIEDVFLENDVSFISLNENLDTSTAFGKAMIGILSVFAQLEREQIAERMAMGKLGRAKAGKAASWSEVARPYGYTIDDNDIYEVVKHEAKIVKDIFKKYLAGSSISGMSYDFSEKMIDGKKWHHSTIRRILTNPIYIGGIRFKGEVYDGQHDPIIDKDDFEEAQRQVNSRRIKHYEKHNNRRPFQSKYVLSGLLTCGKCGCPMVISYAAKRTDGSRNMYYKCQSRVKAYRKKYDIKKACGDDIFHKEELESLVYEEIRSVSLEDSSIDYLKTEETKINIGDYEKEIKRLQKQNSKLTDLYLDSLIEKEDFVKRQNSLEDKKRYFETEIKILREQRETDTTQENALVLIKKFSDNFDELERKDKKNIVNELIRSITVNVDSIKIQWVFTDK